jgi:hypothetical protein
MHPFGVRTILFPKHAQHVVLIATAGRGGLLQPVCCSDCHVARSCHGNSRVAVGTRRSKTERHPFDASGHGMPVHCLDLYGVVHTHENQTQTRRPVWIPLANRSCSRRHRRNDGAAWWVSQWRERISIDISPRKRITPDADLRR